MEKATKSTGLYVEVPTALKLELERVAFQRTQAGNRTTLRQVVLEALEEYLAEEAEVRAYDAAKASGETAIPFEPALAEIGPASY